MKVQAILRVRSGEDTATSILQSFLTNFQGRNVVAVLRTLPPRWFGRVRVDSSTIKSNHDPSIFTPSTIWQTVRSAPRLCLLCLLWDLCSGEAQVFRCFGARSQEKSVCSFVVIARCCFSFFLEPYKMLWSTTVATLAALFIPSATSRLYSATAFP